MHAKPTSGPRAFLRTIGSLWFAAVLLMLLLVAMACATVFESLHGAERTLAAFYGTWWFELLLWLFGINVLAAVVVRYPFSKKQVGFVLTHASILVTLLGALITKHLGVDGQVSIAEGETVDEFTAHGDALIVLDRRDEATASVDLDNRAFRGFAAVNQPKAPVLELDRTRFEVKRYLPDTIETREVRDDNPQPQLAVELSLSPTGRDDPTWFFAEQTGPLGNVDAAFRVVTDEAELVRLLSESVATQPTSMGTVKIDYAGVTHEIPVEDCLLAAVPLGDSGYAVRVLRYLPHAIVGDDRQLINASDRPVNPAIEVEITGPSVSEKRFAFARFPGMGGHKAHQIEGLDLVLVTPADFTPVAPIEVLSGPDGKLYVRLGVAGMPVVSRELAIGTPVETPWPGQKLAVLRRYDHARMVQGVKAAEPIREERVPAILVKASTADGSDEVWLRKYRPGRVTVGGRSHELIYGNKTTPLGFDLTLERFRVGYYPGGRKERSYESLIDIVDPATGDARWRVISMNNPTQHGGYTFFQSRYTPGSQPPVSVLSVSRDPGESITFTGYVGMIAGMLVVLGTRIAERRRRAALPGRAQEEAPR